MDRFQRWSRLADPRYRYRVSWESVECLRRANGEGDLDGDRRTGIPYFEGELRPRDRRRELLEHHVRLRPCRGQDRLDDEGLVVLVPQVNIVRGREVLIARTAAVVHAHGSPLADLPNRDDLGRIDRPVTDPEAGQVLQRDTRGQELQGLGELALATVRLEVRLIDLIILVALPIRALRGQSRGIGNDRIGPVRQALAERV